MKKFASLALLSICVTFIVITSGNSRAGIPLYNVTNITDTTPVHHTVKHHTTMHHTVKHTTKLPVKDSTQQR